MTFTPVNDADEVREALGNKTIEGLYDGLGTLAVTDTTGEVSRHSFENPDNTEFIVKIGQIMQWSANKKEDLAFYEICEPPYTDGRFENISDTD